MTPTKLDTRFFDSTRGQIILLLRGSPKTVGQLATELNITDNAVRAHLLALERDGLIAQIGTAKGFRKPHYIYGLADESRHLFPKAYDSILNKLLAVLKSRLSAETITEMLREVGRKVAGDGSRSTGRSLDKRMKQTLSALESLGGAAKAVDDGIGLRIESESCPFADVVAEHPEVCKATEAAVGELLRERVTEKCDRTGLPKCRFEIELGKV
jgi:predicted ArsR family transcriptional regulator